jgi:predicted NodU family carbamoyl transferase
VVTGYRLSRHQHLVIHEKHMYDIIESIERETSSSVVSNVNVNMNGETE